jgi:hypothetical protein
MNKKALLLTIAILLMVSLACYAPTAAAPTPPPEGAAATAAILTYQAAQSQTALAALGGATLPGANTSAPSDTPQPTGTTAPSETPTFTFTPTLTFTPTFTFTPTLTPSETPTVTNTPIPCNWAKYITDVTIPDGTEINTNNLFDKIWRIQNIGSCTWTSGYKIIFDHGDQMNAPLEAQLTTGTIAPGSTIDIKLTLRAPNSEGVYQGFFRLKSSDNQIFGIGNTADKPFWVKIESVIPALPPPVALPDLVITDISWNPSPIHDDTPIHFKVKIHNGGGMDAGPFTVRFWARSTFAGVSCAWAVPGLDMGDTEVLDCNFTFASPYAPGQTKAIIDAEATVAELNEGNNTYLEPIEVNP